jgi:hypothetical protein
MRLVYLSVRDVFALLRLLPVSDRDKDAEILVLRHQVTVLQRQLGATRPRLLPGDRAFLAPAASPRDRLRRPGTESAGPDERTAQSPVTVCGHPALARSKLTLVRVAGAGPEGRRHPRGTDFRPGRA